MTCSALLFAGAVLALAPRAAGAGQVRGRIVSEADGRPLAGATVVAVAFESPLEMALREARRTGAARTLATVETRPDGSFVLSLPAGAAARLQVSGPAHAPTMMMLDGIFNPQEDLDVGEVGLGKAEGLTGRIVDPQGGPAVGAAVTLWPGGTEVDPATTTTGADGSFRFTNAAATGNRLRIEAPAFATYELRGLRAGPVSKISLSLGRSVRGSVVLPDGRTPAPGAAVRFEGRATTRWTEARADGTFVLDGIPAGSGRLVADLGDRGHGALALVAAGETPRIVLAPPGSLTGRVIDAASGAAVPHLRVTVAAAGSAFFAYSGSDGRYAVRGLPARSYGIVVDDPRYVPWRRSGLSVEAGRARAVDVPLTRGATLAGKIVDEKGSPIEGAVGRLLKADERTRGFFPPGGRDARTESTATFHSAKDGSFRAARLAPGEGQRLQVQQAEHEPITVGGISLAPGGARAELVVVLPSGLALQGVVKDSEGRPVPGADVDLIRDPIGGRGRPGLRSEETFTIGSLTPRQSGLDGRFEIRGLSAGDWVLTVAKPGYARERVEPLKVAADMAPVQVVLKPGSAIRGFVRNRDGNGVPGLRVAATSGGFGAFGRGPGRGGAGGAGGEPTGPDGSFAIEGLEAGKTYDVQVVAGPRGPRRSDVEAPVEGLELTLTTGGRIRGRVTDDTGQPVTDFEAAYVIDRSGGGRFGGGPGGGGPGAFGRGPTEKMSFHSEDGAFVLEDVPPGKWAVEVTASGYQTGRAGALTVEEDGAVEGVEVHVEKGATIGGRVLESRSGRPVADAAVEARASGGAGPRRPGQSTTDTTDADGHFEIGGLGPGTYVLTARHPDWSDGSATVLLRADAAAVEIRLGQGGSLSGTVVAGGRPATGATVALGIGTGGFRGGAPSSQTVVTDASGRFRFDRLTVGRYQVTASLQGQTSAPVDAVLTTPDATPDVTVTIAAGARVQGNVSGLSQAMLTGVRVSAGGPDGFSSSTRAAADGSFELAGAPVGVIRLRADAGDPSHGMRSATGQVTIADGQTDATAQIVFEGSLRLDGTVTRAGQPVADAMVSASPAGAWGRAAGARTSEAGAYALEGLMADTYQVMVQADGTPPLRRTVDVTADTTLDIDAPAARIAGTVVEAGGGRALANAVVRIQGGRRGASASTDSSGRFVLEGLDPVAYHLSVQKAAYQMEMRDVTAAEDGDVRIELKRGDGIGVSAHDGIYGMALRQLIVRVLDPAGTAVFNGPVALDADGCGEIPSLRAGAYQMRVGAPGYAPAFILSLTVPAPTVAVTLTPGGSIQIQAGPRTLALPNPTGHLLTSSGASYDGSPDGRTPLTASPRPIAHVAPGHYTLAVDGGVTRELDVSEGGSTVVSLP